MKKGTHSLFLNGNFMCDIYRMYIGKDKRTSYDDRNLF